MIIKLYTYALLLVVGFSVSPLAMADKALATAKNCMTCHMTDIKLIGPSYKDIAAKYNGNKDAPNNIATKIIRGSVGVWSSVPMPPNPQVTPDESKKLTAWILSQK